MPLSKVKPSTLIAFLCLGIIVVILLFTFCSFDVNADDVITGYNNTRKYAADAKKLQFAVDNFKEAVEEKQEDEEARNNFAGVEVSDLGKWNQMLTDEQYEAYTSTLSMPKGEKWASSDKPPTVDIVPAAKMNGEVLISMTDDGTAKRNDSSVDYLGGQQCCGFANWFMTKYMYGEFLKDTTDYPIYGSFTPSGRATEDLGMSWEPEYNIALGFLNDTEGAKEFFWGVTPGTLVRVNSGKGYDHSYIILGADENNIVTYECNQNYTCGIKLAKYTWEGFAAEGRFVYKLIGIMAPPNTALPTGCTSNAYKSMGHVLTADEITTCWFPVTE